MSLRALRSLRFPGWVASRKKINVINSIGGGCGGRLGRENGVCGVLVHTSEAVVEVGDEGGGHLALPAFRMLIATDLDYTGKKEANQRLDVETSRRFRSREI